MALDPLKSPTPARDWAHELAECRRMCQRRQNDTWPALAHTMKFVVRELLRRVADEQEVTCVDLARAVGVLYFLYTRAPNIEHLRTAVAPRSIAVLDKHFDELRAATALYTPDAVEHWPAAAAVLFPGAPWRLVRKQAATLRECALFQAAARHYASVLEHLTPSEKAFVSNAHNYQADDVSSVAKAKIQTLLAPWPETDTFEPYDLFARGLDPTTDTPQPRARRQTLRVNRSFDAKTNPTLSNDSTSSSK